MKQKIIALLLCLGILALSTASADTLTFSGKAVCDGFYTQKAVYGGKIESVLVNIGDRVSKGDLIATIETEKVYAKQDGVARVFGETGDAAEDVAERYGAVAYVEPAVRYTAAATTKGAYNKEENKIVHAGEKVWLHNSENGHKGSGQITAVSEEGYTVEVLSGKLTSGENVRIYRSDDYASDSRIGRGVTALAPYAYYNSAGLIAAFDVSDGEEVKRGDVLFETVSGAYAGKPKGKLTEILAETDGVIESLSIMEGVPVMPEGDVAVIAPDGALKISAYAGESDLNEIHVGDGANVEFTYFKDGKYAVKGAIERISKIGVALEGVEEARYQFIVNLDDKEDICIGMTADVSVLEDN